MTGVEEKIKDWLNQQGYPLEMRVASEFKRHGLHATLANFYDDPNLGNSRQIDVIASIEDHVGYHRVEFVVECKKSKEKPWILLSSSGASDGFSPLFEYALTSLDARTGIVQEDIDKMFKLPWMKYQGSTGVGLVTAFSDQKDIAFDAARGVMAAAISRRKKIMEMPIPAVIVFPVVVFENRLFECNLTEENELSIDEIDEAKLFFPMSFGGQSGQCIYITTAKNLEKFVADAALAAKELGVFLQPSIDMFREDLKKNRPIRGAVW